MLESTLSWAGRLSPWLIIGALSYAALFIKPTVNPPPLNQPYAAKKDARMSSAPTAPMSCQDGQVHWPWSPRRVMN